MAKGVSPFGRTTYRYSPFVAIFLLGNYHTFIGKISFITGDIITGWLVQRTLDSLGCPEKVRFVSTVVWMLNPYTITMSTRGSFESITSALLVAVLHSVLEDQVVIAAILYGIVTHLRIYPIIFSVPFAFFFFGENKKKNVFGVQYSTRWCGNRRDSRCRYSLISHGSGTKKKPRRYGSFSFAVYSASLFVLLAFANYSVYGFDFLEEAFLYHLHRRDIRHNFSPSFHGEYISPTSTSLGTNWINEIPVTQSHAGLVVQMLGLVPQFATAMLVGMKFAKNLSFALYAQTVAFVALNRVCTAQYFVWYICLFPIVLPGWTALCSGSHGMSNCAQKAKKMQTHGDEKRRRVSLGPGSNNLCRWQVVHVMCLCSAYQLEFHGKAIFGQVWITGILFSFAHASLMANCVKYEQNSLAHA